MTGTLMRFIAGIASLRWRHATFGLRRPGPRFTLTLIYGLPSFLAATGWSLIRFFAAIDYVNGVRACRQAFVSVSFVGGDGCSGFSDVTLYGGRLQICNGIFGMTGVVECAPDDYTVEPEAATVVSCLRSSGVAVLRRPDAIGDCAARFDALIQRLVARAGSLGPHQLQYHPHPANPTGQVLRVHDLGLLEDEQVYNQLASQIELFSEVCRLYLGEPVRCPSSVFLTSDEASPDVLLPWHFDRQHSLKLYVLASAVGEGDGGLLVSPGTHLWGRALADRHVLLGGQLGALSNDVPPALVQQQYKFTGMPGDMIIFDSDCFHMAQQVRPGQVRRVVRLHAHRLPVHKYADAVSGAGMVAGFLLRLLRPWLRKRVRQLGPAAQPAFVRTRPANRRTATLHSGGAK
ncbi:phytanoyl-CoA dioxygenase family protein [Abyssibacter profundi]|uniref:phytanoyl-CoA dioxygenase family protein n=1 Tax=Abyssibacter profundi TaxID=2182787 RepID=UPI001057E38D|nr:phytanoyl-CoA dioxygenase family protein [Abyssibacter profundi]